MNWIPTRLEPNAATTQNSFISKDQQRCGTGIFAHGLVVHFAVGSGGDKTGLGRWTWSQFSGKNGVHLRCVSFYRPTSNKVVPSAVWSQHRAYFQLRGDDRDPCLAFYEDLRGEVQAWLAAGDQIVIGGDLNDHVLKPTISLFFSQLGLHNLIFEHHSPIGAPTTLSQNKQRKILDSFWGTANISVTRCGCCHPKTFPLGGPSVVWMDLMCSCALGHCPPVPHTANILMILKITEHILI